MHDISVFVHAILAYYVPLVTGSLTSILIWVICYVLDGLQPPSGRQKQFDRSPTAGNKKTWTYNRLGKWVVFGFHISALVVSSFLAYKDLLNRTREMAKADEYKKNAGLVSSARTSKASSPNNRSLLKRRNASHPAVIAKVESQREFPLTPIVTEMMVCGNSGISTDLPKRLRPVVKTAKVVFKPTPKYTNEALSLGVAGVVLMQISVDEQGGVQGVDVLEGLGHGLDEAATVAARGMRFTPALDADGLPVAWKGQVKATFQLSG